MVREIEGKELRFKDNFFFFYFIIIRVFKLDIISLILPTSDNELSSNFTGHIMLFVVMEVMKMGKGLYV